ncbi:hypothetical protein AB1Y20_013726 [Prymnesium parvum]|uniref:Hexosyltransferase n=1 Tax=Prymnesium parvum TaxID=97485 RepID=A0AB34IGG1_PRYPA
MPPRSPRHGAKIQKLLLLFAFAARGDSSRVQPLQPSSESIRNVLFSLTRGIEAIPLLQQRSRCLSFSLDRTLLFDEVIFHAGNLQPVQLAGVERARPPRLVDVRDYEGFIMPELDHASIERVRRMSPEDIGYRHMCRFMSMSWFKALALYEYAMRVDDDVCVRNFGSNPFLFMQQRELVYGYAVVQTDESHAETLATLPLWLSSHLANANLTTQYEVHKLVSPIYFTNFFISRVDWWLQAEVSDHLRG